MTGEVAVLFVAAVLEIIWRFPIKSLKSNEKIIEKIVNERIKTKIDEYYEKKKGRIDKLVDKLDEELKPLDIVTRNIRNFRWVMISGILLMVVAIIYDLIPEQTIRVWLIIPGVILGVFFIETPIIILWEQGKVEKYIRENNGEEHDKRGN